MRAPQPRYIILLAVVLASLSGGTHAAHTSKRVFLIRHGKSIWNESSNLFRNWRDSPLSETGIAQCTDGYEAIRRNGLYNYLKGQHHDGNLKSFFSPLTRAAETILLMFGLQDQFAYWYDVPGYTNEVLVPLNLVALPDACERVSTSPNDGEGTDKLQLINRYASFAGRGLDSLHGHSVDTKANVHGEEIAVWREWRLPSWERRVKQVMNLTQIPCREWWPQRNTFGWGLFRNREREDAVTDRIHSVMNEVMASQESDVVIAGHSHYFRQLIDEFLESEGSDPAYRADLDATLKKYSKETMKNTQVLMIDFTGERTPDGKYVVNKVVTVYHPDSPYDELAEDTFDQHDWSYV